MNTPDFNTSNPAISLVELRAIAENAMRGSDSPAPTAHFAAKADPITVLRLIDELEAARAALAAKTHYQYVSMRDLQTYVDAGEQWVLAKPLTTELPSLPAEVVSAMAQMRSPLNASCSPGELTEGEDKRCLELLCKHIESMALREQVLNDALKDPGRLKFSLFSDSDGKEGISLQEYATDAGYVIGDSFTVTETWLRERTFAITKGGPSAKDPKANFEFTALDDVPARNAVKRDSVALNVKAYRDAFFIAAFNAIEKENDPMQWVGKDDETYTANLFQAGVYSESEAFELMKENNEYVMVPLQFLKEMHTTKTVNRLGRDNVFASIESLRKAVG